MITGLRLLTVPWAIAILAPLLDAESHPACTASPAIAAALAALPSRTVADTGWEFRQKRLHALEQLVKRHPDDMFARRAYAVELKQTEPDKITAEYRALYERNPDDPAVAFIYGLLLEGRRTPEAIKVLEAALAKSPDYPWPHRPLARIYTSRVFQNKDRGLAHAKAAMDSCPDDPWAYGFLSRISDKPLIAAGAARLRALAEKKTDAEGISAYQILWPLEFKTRSTAEYGAVREQVRHDLYRIRSLKLDDREQWYATLINGYKLLDDQKQLEWAEDEQARRFPMLAVQTTIARWTKSHPYPKAEDPPAKRTAFYRERLKEANRQIRAYPSLLIFRMYRFNALASLDETTAAELESAVEEYLQFVERDAGPDGPSAYTYLNIANALAKRHLRPERVIAIAQKAIAKPGADYELSDLNATKDNVAEYNFYRPFNFFRAMTLSAGAYLDLDQPDNAAKVLAGMEERLQSIKELSSAKEEYKREYAGQMSAYWLQMARTAETRNQPQDAMAFYTNALLARLESQQKLETGEKDELGDRAHELWSKLGGTREGWNAWYGKRADVLARNNRVDWESMNDPFPAFGLTDTNGKTWTQASLKGKVTFLNFWASW